jgi:hypothetical protein
MIFFILFFAINIAFKYQNFYIIKNYIMKFFSKSLWFLNWYNLQEIISSVSYYILTYRPAELDHEIHLQPNNLTIFGLPRILYEGT